MIKQNQWRAIASATVICAALMAWYAVRSEILYDSAAHFLSLFSNDVNRAAVGTSVFFCIAYWGVFSLLIFVSLYVAALDIRYIRLQYVLGKREILKGTIDDTEFRDTLIDAIHKK